MIEKKALIASPMEKTDDIGSPIHDGRRPRIAPLEPTASKVNAVEKHNDSRVPEDSRVVSVALRVGTGLRTPPRVVDVIDTKPGSPDNLPRQRVRPVYEKVGFGILTEGEYQWPSGNKKRRIGACRATSGSTGLSGISQANASRSRQVQPGRTRSDQDWQSRDYRVRSDPVATGGNAQGLGGKSSRVGPQYQVTSLPPCGTANREDTKMGEVLWEPQLTDLGKDVHSLLQDQEKLPFMRKILVLQALHDVGYDAVLARKRFVELMQQHQPESIPNPLVLLTDIEVYRLHQIFKNQEKKDFGAIAKHSGHSMDTVLAQYYSWKGSHPQEYQTTKTMRTKASSSDSFEMCCDGASLISCKSPSKVTTRNRSGIGNYIAEIILRPDRKLHVEIGYDQHLEAVVFCGYVKPKGSTTKEYAEANKVFRSIGDIICAVNGESIQGMTWKEASRLIEDAKKRSSSVYFLVHHLSNQEKTHTLHGLRGKQLKRGKLESTLTKKIRAEGQSARKARLSNSKLPISDPHNKRTSDVLNRTTRSPSCFVTATEPGAACMALTSYQDMPDHRIAANDRKQRTMKQPPGACVAQRAEVAGTTGSLVDTGMFSKASVRAHQPATAPGILTRQAGKVNPVSGATARFARNSLKVKSIQPPSGAVTVAIPGVESPNELSLFS